MLSYAGIHLGAVVPHVVEAIERQLTLRDIYDFEERHWPGQALAHLPFPAHRRSRPIKLNTLYWPRDASRWAVGYFLIDDEHIDDIRAATSDGKNAATFTMDTLSTSLYMLPPRPISQIQGANGLSVLTIVDARWHWWQKAGAVSVEESVATWTQIYTQIGAILGLTIHADAIHSAYLKPPPEIATQYRSMPLLLDAVALSLGHRIIREFDGTVRAVSAGTSRTRLEANLVTYPENVGGGVQALGLSGKPPNDLDALLPAAVKVAFRKLDARAAGFVGTLRDPLDHYVKEITLSSLALSEMQSRTGRTGATKVIHSSAGANYTGGAANPENLTDLDALATRIARDYYLYRTAPLDVRVKTIAHQWQVNGLDDALEFSWRSDGVYTRVQRDPWDDTREDVLHWSRRVGLIPFWAEATSRSATGGRHAWTEKVPAASGTFTDVPNGLGRDGTDSVCPAYEANDEAPALPRYVQLWRGFRNTGSAGLEFVFHTGVGRALIKLTAKSHAATWIEYSGTFVTDGVTPAPLAFAVGDTVPDPIYHLRNIDVVVSSDSSAPTVVRAWKGAGDWWLFDDEPRWEFVLLDADIAPVGGFYQGAVQRYQQPGGGWAGFGSCWIIDANAGLP